jgi:dihydroorotate dehydrogenase electron transfer subunit
LNSRINQQQKAFVKQFKARIISNSPVSAELFKLEFAVDPSIKSILPGHFFTVRIGDTTVPFLRRPFAFSSFDPVSHIAQALYKRRGRGTELLSAFAENDEIDIIAPCGNFFPLPLKEKTTILAAGGIGIGPILFFAKLLLTRNINFTCVLGWRTFKDAIGNSEISGIPVSVCTDDGSAGYKGTTVNFIQTSKLCTANTVVYACGPSPMLKACHETAVAAGADCFVSVEQVMACGVGACMGCAIKASENRGYFRVCHDGPVFNSRDLEWT